MDSPLPQHDPNDEQLLIPYEPPPAYLKYPKVVRAPSGSRRIHLTVPEAMYEYLNLQEVIREIKVCRDYDDGRSITAILRVAREQSKARSPYVGAGFGTSVYLPLAAALGLLAPHTGLALPITTLGFISWLVGLVDALTWLKHSEAALRFGREKSSIEVVAAEAIEGLVQKGRVPKRLYMDDIRMLKRLQATNKWFKPIAKEVLDRADR
jgi:hypothetical protein